MGEEFQRADSSPRIGDAHMATPKASPAGLIRDFFGPRVPGATASDFMTEYKALSEADRLWMAREIAKQRGLKAEDCAFPLSDG